MDENELVMIADNESTNGHPKVPTDNNVYPMYEERGGGGRREARCHMLRLALCRWFHPFCVGQFGDWGIRGRGGPLQGAMHGLEGLESHTVATAKAAPRGRGACPH